MQCVKSILGELISLLYMFTMFKLKKKFRVRRNFFHVVKSGRDALNELMSVALPSLGSRLIGNVSWFLEPIIVANSLAIAGITTSIATKQYGLLTGFAMPLMMLPSFVTSSLSTALVPAISEANTKRNSELVEHRLQQALRFSLLAGGLSVIILYVFADPLMKAMYGNSNGSQFIKIMAPFFLLQYYQGPLQATLQALDMARAAMINSLIGAIVKLAVIFVLASRPEFGINGAALGIVTSIVLVTLLHFATILKKISFTIYVLEYVKFSIVTILACVFGYWIYHHISFHELAIIHLLICIILTSILYVLLLLGTKLLTKSDLRLIPIINKFI